MILPTAEAPSSIHQDLKTSTSVTKQGTNFTGLELTSHKSSY